MKKLVLGIISVFAMQVGFVALNWSGDEFSSDVGRVREFYIDTESWPVIRNARPPYPETTVAAVESISIAAPKTETAIAKVAHKPVERKARTNQFNQADVVFEPKVITYSTVPASFTERPIVAKSKVEPAVSPQPQPIKKKRSFLQKTGSVIKKPFVWIKDLVAKLD